MDSLAEDPALSDDLSFYGRYISATMFLLSILIVISGDYELKTELQSRVDTFVVSAWWREKEALDE